MSRSRDALAAARELDARVERDIAEMNLPAPKACFQEIRAYLQRMTDQRRITHPRIKDRAEGSNSVILVGPSNQKGPDGSALEFSSGAQLSFGIKLRHEQGLTRLLAYRFHLLLPAGGVKFMRIDLNQVTKGNDALQVPRSHIHVGFEHVHIPFPVLRPLEILDRIFHIFEPAFSR